MAITIYVLSNPLDGVVRYVGKTKDIVERYRGHLKEAMTAKRMSKKNNWIKGMLNRGIKPNIETIEVVEYEQGNEAEKYYILKYKELGYKLLNMTDGGDGGVMSEEVRMRWSKIRKGRTSSRKGIVMSQETKDKVSASKKGKNKGKESHRSKAILKIDKVTDEVICEYDSISQAGEELNIRTSINNALSGVSKTAGGYKWKYKK